MLLHALNWTLWKCILPIYMCGMEFTTSPHLVHLLILLDCAEIVRMRRIDSPSLVVVARRVAANHRQRWEYFWLISWTVLYTGSAERV